MKIILKRVPVEEMSCENCVLNPQNCSIYADNPTNCVEDEEGEIQHYIWIIEELKRE
uniref:Uncharacterized protein n=1 Tax=viral metagenome TaxID=1070528 RepID=A0A6M3LL41_9ZZZZ